MRKTNPPPPPQGAAAAAGTPGHNFDLTREQLGTIEQLTREIQGLERDRSAINDQISERRSAIKAFGIDMDAWKAAKRRKEMDPEDRDNFDRSQAMCNAALGVPIQADLFEHQGDEKGAGTLPGGLH